jgi:hypothetical protein
VADFRRKGTLETSLCWPAEELERLAMFAIAAKNDLARLAAPRAPLSSEFLDAYRKKLARGGSFMREEVAELLAAHDSLLEAYHETAPLRAAPRALEGPPDSDRIDPARASLRVLEHMLVSKMEEPWGRMTHHEFDAWATGVRKWIAHTQVCLEPERLVPVGGVSRALPEPTPEALAAAEEIADELWPTNAARDEIIHASVRAAYGAQFRAL